MNSKEKYEKISYNNEYNKNNYSQFKVYLRKDSFNKLNELLKEKKLTRSDFIKISMDNLERGDLIMKKYIVFSDGDYYKRNSNGFERDHALDDKIEFKEFNNLIDAEEYLKNLKIEIDIEDNCIYANYYSLSDVTNIEDKDDYFCSDYVLKYSDKYSKFGIEEIIKKMIKTNLNHLSIKPSEVDSYFKTQNELEEEELINDIKEEMDLQFNAEKIVTLNELSKYIVNSLKKDGVEEDLFDDYEAWADDIREALSNSTLDETSTVVNNQLYKIFISTCKLEYVANNKNIHYVVFYTVDIYDEADELINTLYFI